MHSRYVYVRTYYTKQFHFAFYFINNDVFLIVFFERIRKAENKLINKSSPFPLPHEFYLYTPLGMQSLPFRNLEINLTHFLKH